MPVKKMLDRFAFYFHLWKIRRSIDMAKFQAIHQKYSDVNWGKNKGWKIQKRLKIDLRHTFKLGLNHSPPLTILDIGTGFGYFPYICRYFGHDVLGVDMAVPAYRDIIELFRIPWRQWRIDPFEPLCDFGKRFDLITAILIFFNNPHSSQPWNVKEWTFLLKDLATNHLKPNGRIYLTLNRNESGECYDSGLHQFFLHSGAEVNQNVVHYRTVEQLLELQNG